MHDDTQNDDGQAQPPQPVERDREKHGMIGWGISGVIHGAAVVAMTFVVFATQQKEHELPPFRPVPPPAQMERITERQPADLEDRPDMPILTDEVAETPAPLEVMVEVPVEEISANDETNPDPGRQGSLETPVDLAMALNSGFIPATGPASGAPGPFGDGRPDGAAKRGKIKQGGATRPSVGAVKSALRWLARHQSPDGSWQAEGYFRNCDGEQRCEPGKSQGSGTDKALTAYAVLGFLGDGYDHRSASTFRPVVNKGIKKLLGWQQADGSFGPSNYEHAIVTQTLAQAYAQTNDETLRTPVTRAVRVILDRQNQDPSAQGSGANGLGWDYTAATGRNDSSVTGWNIMALKSAMIAGIPGAEKGLNGSKRWLEGAWKAGNPVRTGVFAAAKEASPYDQTRFPYCWYHETGKIDMSPAIATAQGGAQSMESVGLLCAAFTGRAPGDPLFETLANSVSAHQTPTAWPTNTYYLYYNTLGMFQVGGKRWEDWNGAVRDLLVKAQRSDGCFEGSWDSHGTVFHGHGAGRVLSTCYTLLALEVYWIYDRIHKPAKH